MKHKPPSVGRLRHYEMPIPMRGDPAWDANSPNTWEARQKSVYEAAMEAKRNAKTSPQSCALKQETGND